MPTPTVKPEPKPTDEIPEVRVEQPRTLDVKPCVICKHNVVNGRCNHCGYEPDREPKQRD